MSTSKNRKLLDETSEIMRLHHYSRDAKGCQDSFPVNALPHHQHGE